MKLKSCAGACVVAVGVSLGMVACGGAQDIEPVQSPQVTSAPATTPAPSVRNDTFASGGNIDVVPTSGGGIGGATDAPVGADGLNDALIAKIADTVNTGEIEQGRYASQHATNPRVKQFAQHMVAAHSGIGQAMTATLKKESIVPAASTLSAKLSADASSTLSALQVKTGPDFDRSYIDAQAKAHKDALDLFDNKLIPNTKDAQLKASLQEVRPMVAEHLKEAQDIQKALGSP